MFTCANCGIVSCEKEEKEVMPKNCPMTTKDYTEITKEYLTEQNKAIFVTAAKIESEGYCEWSRAREVVEFAKRMSYKKIGLAFCKGLKREAKIFDTILRDHGFEVSSIVCKNGGISKEDFGIDDADKLHPGCFEPACNPIAQAIFLNEEKVDLNVVIGLCVGHDTLFYKYAESPVTTLITKDRALAHNPAGALYCYESYYRKQLKAKKNK
jgi:uncharacterized metal-binding protein